MTFISKCIIGAALLAACGEPDAPPKQCDVSGHACTWLGMPGQTAFNGDGHDKLDTMIYWSMDTLFAQDGTVYFIDWNNHLVRHVLADNTVKTVLGWNDPIFPGDGDDLDPNAELTNGAPGTDVQLNHPTDLAQLADGTIVVMAWHNHKIRVIDPATDTVKILAGGNAGFAGDGKPLSSTTLLKQPSRMAFDENANMFIVDAQNQRIREVDNATRIITSIAGNGTKGFGGDDGPAAACQLSFAIGSNPEPQGGIAYKDGQVYVADTENNRIRKIDLGTMTITTFAGTGHGGFTADDVPAKQSDLFHPRDMEIGPDGNLYIADTDNGRIRMIDLATGTIHTVVGTGVNALDADDDRLATDTALNRPFGIDFDPAGNIYVSDTLNSRILKVSK